jgi:hypothetical protein
VSVQIKMAHSQSTFKGTRDVDSEGRRCTCLTAGSTLVVFTCLDCNQHAILWKCSHLVGQFARALLRVEQERLVEDLRVLVRGLRLARKLVRHLQ